MPFYLISSMYFYRCSVLSTLGSSSDDNDMPVNSSGIYLRAHEMVLYLVQAVVCHDVLNSSKIQERK